MSNTEDCKQYDGMTERDIKNLNFLLNASDEVLRDWAKSVEQDDLDYANELLMMLKYRILDVAAERYEPKEAAKILEKYKAS